MKKTKIALITGGGTGLGQALAIKLAKRGITVFVVGRRLAKLLATKNLAPDLIQVIHADISQPSGRKLIAEKLILLNDKIDYLVHNAAIVKPIVSVEKITLSAFRRIQAINLEAPLFLTQLLLPLLNTHSRILHISSDCAHTGLAYWIPYCVSKAGLFMLYQCLKKELADRKIHVGSIDPGMMDTPMQKYICNKKIQFPEKLSVAELKQQGLLFSVVFSAEYCAELLLDRSVDDFCQQEHYPKKQGQG